MSGLTPGREKVRKEVQETGEWGEIDCFFCRTGEGRKLRVKAGLPKGVRLSIERNLDKPRKETGESRDRHVKGVFHVQDRKGNGFSELCIRTRKKWKTKLRKDTTITCMGVVRAISRAEEERE